MPVEPGEEPAVPRDEGERLALTSLLDKYERMRALRGRLGRGTPAPAERAQLRSLAADFPGALRELDTLSTAEIDHRLTVAQVAARGEGAPAWLLWTAVYHTLMKRALASRRGAPATEGERLPLPQGRLNVLVFAALALRFELAAEVLWDRLFPATGRAARPYRAAPPARG